MGSSKNTKGKTMQLPESVRAFFHFGKTERIDFYEMLSALIKSGVPLDSCLRRLYERKDEKKRSDAWILKKWISQMDQGVKFHDAIKDEIPSQERILLAVGTMSNGDTKESMGNCLDQVISATKGAHEIQNVLKTGLTYPLVLFVALMIIIIGFATGLAPEFARMLPESSWTGSSGLLLTVSKHVASIWPYFIFMVVVLTGLIFWSLPRWTGKWRERMSWFPPYAIYRSYVSSIFLIALASMLNTGTPLDAALKKILKNASPYLSFHLIKMVNKMGEGVPSGDALETGLIDDVTADQLYVFSRTIDFSKALKSLGERALKQGTKAIILQTGFVRQLGVFGVGMMICWIYVSTYDLNEKLANPEVANAAIAQVKK